MLSKINHDCLIPNFVHRFFFDFSSTYVGVGMICPYMVNISLLIGAVLSWGIMWPIIETKKGIWYKAELSDSNLHGMNGYRVLAHPNLSRQVTKLVNFLLIICQNFIFFFICNRCSSLLL